MTAEDVYKILLAAGEEVGLATVYRVLTQFEGAGLVIRHNFEGGRAVFEINQGSHHDHMVCIECGKIFEFQDIAIEERQLKVASIAGFVVEDHSLYLYGVCAGMRKHGSARRSRVASRLARPTPAVPATNNAASANVHTVTAPVGRSNSAEAAMPAT